MMVKRPGFTGVVVVTLALGIGANTAIFSLVDKLVLRSLPVEEPSRLVLVQAESVNPKFLNNLFSYPDYADYRDRNEVLSGLLAFNQMDGRLGAGEQSEKVSVELVSANYFDVLGVRAARGQLIRLDDERQEGAHPFAVISHGLWRRRFGGDPGVVGQTLMLNGMNYTVVGVAAAGFAGMSLEYPAEMWIPLTMRRQLLQSSVSNQERKFAWLKVVGRLKPGVATEGARASLDLLARDIREAVTPPADLKLPFNEKRILLEPGGKGISFLRKRMSTAAMLLAAIVVLLLTVACANVANLLLARGAGRRKEMAVRMALGAGRGRIIRQLLTESVLLALAGAGAGLVLAVWLYDLLLAFQPAVTISETSLAGSLDGRVLLFTLLVSLVTGIVFGLLPALQSSRPNLIPALKGNDLSFGGRERGVNARHLLVVAQVALSLVLLVGAGLFVRSLQNMLAIDPGFRTENVLIMPIELPRERYAGGESKEFFRRETARQNEFYRQAVEEVKALPSVEAASTSTITPLSSGVSSMGVIIEGYQAKLGEHISIENNKVGPGYHQLLDIQFARGRGFTEQDTESAPGVVVINEAMARLYFQDQNPLGKRLSLGQGMPWLEIVGVTRDTKLHSLTETPIPHFDLPARQHPYGNFAQLLIRTKGEATALIPAVRQKIKTIDPQASVPRVTTLEAELRNSIAPLRMATTLTSLFGAMALVLASVGIYGVMTYAVSRRTREIGVRMALGAQTGDVLKIVLREGILMMAAGLAAGVVGAFALTRLIGSQLYGVGATDPATFVSVAALLTIVALVACYIPARRATKVDPMVALRYE